MTVDKTKTHLTIIYILCAILIISNIIMFSIITQNQNEIERIYTNQGIIVEDNFKNNPLSQYPVSLFVSNPNLKNETVLIHDKTKGYVYWAEIIYNEPTEN